MGLFKQMVINDNPGNEQLPDGRVFSILIFIT